MNVVAIALLNPRKAIFMSALITFCMVYTVCVAKSIIGVVCFSVGVLCPGTHLEFLFMYQYYIAVRIVQVFSGLVA